MTKVTQGARLARLATGMSVGLLMTASGYSAAIAGEVTPANTNGFQHFFDCFGAMIHDGQAHQQYCGPGNAPGPGNGSLGSFSGGAGPACLPVGALDWSPRTVETASLTPDFYIDAPTLNAPALRMATPGGCCLGASLSAPVSVDVASLTPDFGADPSALKGPAFRLAGPGCCYGSLDVPVKVTVASLTPDFYGAPSTPNAPFVQVANCCISSLDAPAFQTFETASLDDSIGSELQTIGQHAVQVACR